MIRPTRRGFLLGLGAALVAAPAIVKAANIMPVKVPKLIVPTALETAYMLDNNTLLVSPAMMARLKHEVGKMALFPADNHLMPGSPLRYCGMDIFVAPPVLTQLIAERPQHPCNVKIGARDGVTIKLGDVHDAIAALKT